MTIQIPDGVARSMEGIASAQHKSVEQVAVESSRSPAAVLRPVRDLPYVSAEAVADLEASILAGWGGAVVLRGDIIEDYPEDARGHSCLMMGVGDARRAVHVVCAPKDEYLAIITAYLPETLEWSRDFRTRRRA